MNLRLTWALVPIAAVIVLAVVLIPRSSAQPAPALVGTDMHGLRAPDFRLTDQFGQPITLSQFRGRTVILTFMESHCTGLCPIVGQAIHRVLVGLGAEKSRVAVLALSTEPEDDSLSSIRHYSQELGMLHSWHYLVASRNTMIPIWHAYYIYAPPKGSSESGDQGHTSATYLIDRRGRERLLLGGAFETETLNQDVRILAGLPVARLRSNIPAPEAGHLAPGFTLAGLNEHSVALSRFRGKAVLLNFWATWCGPCKSEMPELSSWQHAYASKGLIVVGIDQLEAASVVRDFVRRMKISYPIALDSNGTAAALYDIIGTPTSVLIDRQGYVDTVVPGILSKGFLASHMVPLLRAHD